MDQEVQVTGRGNSDTLSRALKVFDQAAQQPETIKQSRTSVPPPIFLSSVERGGVLLLCYSWVAWV